VDRFHPFWYNDVNMKKEILIIVPTRNRSKNIKEFYKLFKENSEISDLCIGMDDDEVEDYPIFDDVIYETNSNMKLVPKLNLISAKYLDQYKYIGFMGDDVRIKTKGWDSILVEPLKNKAGMSYPNDLLQGENLPTAFVTNSSVIKKLGYMVPPELKHFFMDNFYIDWSGALDVRYYFEDVILEHMHPAAGKSEEDATYRSADTVHDDRHAYREYIKKRFKSDLKKIMEIL